MKRLFCLSAALLLTFILGAVASRAVEKIRLGTAVRAFPTTYLPILAAEEKGFWKEAGLDVEWVPFRGSGFMVRGLAAKTFEVGISPTMAVLQAAGRGLPAVVVATVLERRDFYIWVRSDSRFRAPGDLKGAKVGVTGLGGTSHAYVRAIGRKLGIEREIKYVATGGIAQELAALLSGAIDASAMSPFPFLKPIQEGKLRSLLNTFDYLPEDWQKAWVEQVVFSTKEVVEGRPEVLRKMIKALYKGYEFARANPEWSYVHMERENGYDRKMAEFAFGLTAQAVSKDGKVTPKAIENVRNFLLEYGIISAREMPPISELYSNRFVQ